MANRSAQPTIRLRGVRHNNLKNFDLDLPTRQLVVVTGLSGSGKSSLAFDTLFAEGQRRYIETFSPYARQFFDRMDKPQVDRIEGIPPAIAVEQRNTVRTTRSTVGTMTELCDYLKLLWPYLAHLYCRQCGQPVRKDSPQDIWQTFSSRQPAADRLARDYLVAFDLPLSEKLPLTESLALLSRQGYQRLLWQQQVLRLEEALPLLQKNPPDHLTVVQDRLRLQPQSRARFVEACEQAYHFGKGKLAIRPIDTPAVGAPEHFSNRFHCAPCNIEYREPSPALFSFNHPLGACPSCRGFGRIITIDYRLALPDRSKTLAEGVVKPWQTGQGLECQQDLIKFCKVRNVPVDVPFDRLSRRRQEWVLHGDRDYGKDAAHQWPRAWYGVAGYFRWLESKAYKMHVRVLLSRYRTYSPCPDCQGRRFQPESLLFKVPFPDGTTLSLADFYQLPIRSALPRIEQLAATVVRPQDPATLLLNEVRSRLHYMDEVGLGYLTLDRPTRTLSGGETERVNLTACLGSRLVNTLFVLDEPSVGLHARDTLRLVRILHHLRDAGNTVLVVEHEASVIRAADQILDLGPGQGEAGGALMFQGSYQALLQSGRSLTARYLNGTEQASLPARRSVNRQTPRLTLSGAKRHNLKNLTVALPLQRLVCLTGVSGSGKTTLARDELLPALQATLQTRLDPRTEPAEDSPDSEESDQFYHEAGETSTSLTGQRHLARVLLVDQSPLGRTPRSNPAVYVGAFDHLRELYAHTDLARQRGLTASAFSFNSSQGQCERCRGAGFEKIEMQFLSDVHIRCPDCAGRRYRPHILEVLLPVASTQSPPAESSPPPRRARQGAARSPAAAWSIADLLEATVDQAVTALVPYLGSPAGRRALPRLRLLQEVGLGYLRLGQPINTLSGGESQRLKLVAHLADHETGPARPTLFIFDEPTTGLHFHDVRVLLQVFQRLVEAGHSLLVIEHNLDVIQSADWIIDLGPEGGEDGGCIVAEGNPARIARCLQSHTGAALRSLRTRKKPSPSPVPEGTNPPPRTGPMPAGSMNP